MLNAAKHLLNHACGDLSLVEDSSLRSECQTFLASGDAKYRVSTIDEIMKDLK